MKAVLIKVNNRFFEGIALGRRQLLVLLFSSIWLVVSYCGGGMFFVEHYGTDNLTVARLQHGKLLSGMVACCIAELAILLFVRIVLKAMSNCRKEREILWFALPAFLVLLAVLLTNLSYTNLTTGYYGGDEKNIWDAAVNLNPFMFGFTSGLFMVCFFIFPITIGPSLVKIFFCSLIIGYAIYRVYEKLDSKLVFLLYGLFLLRPFREFGIQVHRMQWYGWLYLFAAIKMFFDYHDKKTRTICDVILMALVLNLLAFWRKEGLYWLVLGPLLIYCCYLHRQRVEKQGARRSHSFSVLATFFICTIIIGIPQEVYSLSLQARDQVEWEALFVHMVAEPSFQRDKCTKELEEIQNYIDMERIDTYNNDLGWEAFEECWWRSNSFYEGKYYAIKSTDLDVYFKFKKSTIGVILKQPGAFILSRVKAFAYAARAKNVMDGVKNEEYNLYFPLIILLLLLSASISRKDICMCCLSCGLVIHIFLTSLAMPASYAKYFFEMYTFSYFFGGYYFVRLLDKAIHNNPLRTCDL